MTSTSPPTALRCAHKVNPLGVAPDRVRFGWQPPESGPRQQQRAFQIRVEPDDAREGAVWDTGRVESARSADVPYAGQPLIRGRRYTWRVRVWGEAPSPSGWSEPACFEVELDPVSGWQAAWIGLQRIPDRFTDPGQLDRSDRVVRALSPAPYLRRTFRIGHAVAWARLYITALGLYEARLNGCRVGDAVLAPGWTDYARRVSYQTYDVTGLLRPGENVLAAVLADGWYSGFIGFDVKRAGAHYGTAPELLAQLVIGLADGTEQRVLTDTEWQGRFAMIRHADLLMGEQHDLRLEPHGWDAPGFDPAGWRPVWCRERDARRLVADPGPPVRVTQELAPQSIAHYQAGRQIVDFGQNLTGWLRLRVDGPAGKHVRIRHSEVLASNGSLYTENLRTARQTDEFITPGGAAVFEPRFTVHGFRYAEICGYPGDLDPADVVAQVVHSDVPVTGSFECSEGWLNQLFRNIDWGQRGNFISIPTDCPQRDERVGWLGDAQIFARTACYNRDVAAFFGKWLDDVADAQFSSGAFPDIAPRMHLDFAGAPAWGDAGVIIPWTLHKMYADTGILERHYPSMTAWMDYLERDNPDCLRSRHLGNSYNDWLSPQADETPPELLATAYWAYDAALMAEIAEAIGRGDDAANYRGLWAKIRSAFTDAFVSADGQVTSGTQTAYVLALHMQLVPEDLRGPAVGHLVDAIARTGWRLTTGFVGVGYLLPVLSANGQTPVAYRLLEQADMPSWRYMVEHGATTIWERWDAWTEEHGFQSPVMNSFNHYSLGAVGEWLYRFVLGIEPEAGTAGFARLALRPHPGRPLNWARGSYRSNQGLIAIEWRRDGEVFSFRAQIPPGVTASVHIPSGDAGQVRDGDGHGPAAVARFPGAAGVSEAVFEVGSGIHRFAGPPF
ncbi:MAG: family 78 glycoside hydrolase catalytic domain [Streptosporangiaceae bacterium]